jgi:hypothetical protein
MENILLTMNQAPHFRVRAWGFAAATAWGDGGGGFEGTRRRCSRIFGVVGLQFGRLGDVILVLTGRCGL